MVSAMLVGSGPLIWWIIWNIYIRIAYDELSDSPHAVSLSYYSNMLSGRTIDIVKTIAVAFFSKLLTENIVFLWFFIIASILLVLTSICNKKPLSIVDLGYTLTFVLGAYVVYNTVLLAMYVFSMPYEEAVIVDSYNRYTMTIDTYACGIMVILVMRYLLALSVDKERIGLSGVAFTVMGYLLLPMHLLGIITFVVPPQTPDEELIAEPLRIAIEEYGLPQDQNVSYCLCLVDENTNFYRYHSHIAKTILYSANIDVYYLETPFEFNTAVLGDYDYYILIDSSVATVIDS
jgi:hypothetical protein